MSSRTIEPECIRDARFELGNGRARHDVTDRLARDSLDRLLYGIRRSIGARLRSVLDAEDVLQESLLALLATGACLESLDPTTLARRLRSIAANRIRSAGRHVHAASRTEIHVTEHRRRAWAIQPLPSARDDADANVRRHLALLSFEHRAVLLLRNSLDVSWETTSLVLGKQSVHAAQCLHQRALKAIEWRVRRAGMRSGATVGS